jgi:hypothetical protein
LTTSIISKFHTHNRNLKSDISSLDEQATLKLQEITTGYSTTSGVNFYHVDTTAKIGQAEREGI